MTKQLLIFSRQQFLEPRVIDVTQVVSGMEKMLRRIIGEDIELHVEGTLRKEPALIDPGQLEQVIMNLVVNARDAMPNGGRISIQISRQETTAQLGRLSPGPHVVIDVADTGRGMTEEVLDRVFEPFFTTKEVGQGTGLGLSTVFGIVGRADGHVTGHSTPEQGSRFTVRLPLAEGAAEPAIDREGHELINLSKGSEKILIVEDDPTLCKVIAAILSRSGYRTLTAHDSAEAIFVAEKHNEGIDLLLSDIVLPGVDGVELAGMLSERFGPFKTLFMSGYTEKEQLRRAVELGSHIQKPFTARELTNTIRRILDDSGEPLDAYDDSRARRKADDSVHH